MQATDLRASGDFQAGWGETIEEHLAELGKQRVWLARAVDVHPSTITRVIKGELCPNDELKWKIAGALGVRMDRLWAWPKVVPPHPDQRVA